MEPKVHRCIYLDVLTRFSMSSRILLNLYAMEHILMGCIHSWVWQLRCLWSPQPAEMNSAQSVLMVQSIRKAGSIIEGALHPGQFHFCLLPSAWRCRKLESLDCQTYELLPHWWKRFLLLLRVVQWGNGPLSSTSPTPTNMRQLH